MQLTFVTHLCLRAINGYWGQPIAPYYIAQELHHWGVFEIETATPILLYHSASCELWWLCYTDCCVSACLPLAMLFIDVVVLFLLYVEMSKLCTRSTRGADYYYSAPCCQLFYCWQVIVSLFRFAIWMGHAALGKSFFFSFIVISYSP